jgi:peptide deformylase
MAQEFMYEDLKIIVYPDPRLKKVSAAVTAFDDSLKALTTRMFLLMREARGVGLAAPQVGINIRLFVMNPTGKPEDDAVYVNPVLSEGEGEEEGEEGCLSLPGLNVQIWRAKTVQMDAHDVTGKPFTQQATGYLARIWQHEFDHLNGTMISERMGPVAKLANRKLLRELEEKWKKDHPGEGDGKSKKR